MLACEDGRSWSREPPRRAFQGVCFWRCYEVSTLIQRYMDLGVDMAERPGTLALWVGRWRPLGKRHMLYFAGLLLVIGQSDYDTSSRQGTQAVEESRL